MRAAVSGHALQDPVHHLGLLFILIGAGSARSELVVQTLQAEIPVTLAPTCPRSCLPDHAICNGRYGFTGSASEHDLRSLHDRMGQRS